MNVWVRIVSTIYTGRSVEQWETSLELTTELSLSLYPNEAAARADSDKLGGLVMEVNAASLQSASDEEFNITPESDSPHIFGADGSSVRAPATASIEAVCGKFRTEEDEEGNRIDGIDFDEDTEEWLGALEKEMGAAFHAR